MIYRKQLAVLQERINKDRRRFIQVLIGPRQVGKSTIIKQFLSSNKLPYVHQSADDPKFLNENWIEQIFESVRLKMSSQNLSEFLIIIDEIQNVAQWSDKLKKEWDKDTMNDNNIKVVILGSSRLMLQQGLNESLAGRFENIYVNHWTYKEVKEAFNLSADQYAWFGGYPGSLDLIADPQRWMSYIKGSIIDSVIKKDILLLTRVHKPALLENLFYLACQYSGSILSYNKIIGQLQDAGNTTTLTHYVELLHSAGLLSGLNKYSGTSIVNQRNSSPKFMVQNTAFVGATAYDSFENTRSNPDQWGKVIESTIGAHLVNFGFIHEYEVMYWRQNNAEVDFILKYKNKVVAIEVKSSKVRNKKGMDEFNRQFTPDKNILISPQTISWQEFLMIDPIQIF